VSGAEPERGLARVAVEVGRTRYPWPEGATALRWVRWIHTRTPPGSEVPPARSFDFVPARYLGEISGRHFVADAERREFQISHGAAPRALELGAELEVQFDRPAPAPPEPRGQRGLFG